MSLRRTNLINMKKKNSLFLVISILVVGAYFGYRYLYKDHRDIQGEKPALTVTSEALQGLFVNDNSTDILNKTLLVSGTVTESDSSSITLNDKVHCTLLTSVAPEPVGSQVLVKGRCIGYDDLFELVKLDQCQLTTTN